MAISNVFQLIKFKLPVMDKIIFDFSNKIQNFSFRCITKFYNGYQIFISIYKIQNSSFRLNNFENGNQWILFWFTKFKLPVSDKSIIIDNNW